MGGFSFLRLDKGPKPNPNSFPPLDFILFYLPYPKPMARGGSRSVPTEVEKGVSCDFSIFNLRLWVSSRVRDRPLFA